MFATWSNVGRVQSTQYPQAEFDRARCTRPRGVVVYGFSAAEIQIGEGNIQA